MNSQSPCRLRATTASPGIMKRLRIRQPILGAVWKCNLPLPMMRPCSARLSSLSAPRASLSANEQKSVIWLPLVGPRDGSGIGEMACGPMCSAEGLLGAGLMTPLLSLELRSCPTADPQAVVPASATINQVSLFIHILTAVSV